MTYLHDKNIVHAKLTSVNIYIEPNQQVKISLLDNDEQQLALPAGQIVSPASPGCEQLVSFDLPSLTYLSPELVRSIELVAQESEPGEEDLERKSDEQIGAPHGSRARSDKLSRAVRMDLNKLTTKSDIFSFGTLLYELFEEHFPFSEQDVCNQQSGVASVAQTPTPSPLSSRTRLLMDSMNSALHSTPTLLSLAHRQQPSPFSAMPRGGRRGNIKISASELIYQIGSGQIERRNSERPKCPAFVDQIIAACWAANPDERPNFKQLSFAA